MTLSIHQPRTFRFRRLFMSPFGRLVAAVLLLALTRAGNVDAQIRHLQGSWESATPDSGPRLRLYIRNLEVRIDEPCPGPTRRICTHQMVATAYRPTARAGVEATALVMHYRVGNAVRFSVITGRGDRLTMERFTRDLGDSRRAPVVDTLAFLRERMSTTAPRPLPAPVGDRVSITPQFPWPPPIPTSFQTLPKGLVTAGEGDSLGRVFDKLKLALSRIEGGWWSVYAIGEDGFAVVTKIEAIEADGRPKPLPDRWLTPSDRLPLRISGIRDYVKALLFARAGRYRFLVLAVTDRPISGADSTITSAQAMRLLRGGEDNLPSHLRIRTLGPSGRCVALIYEFERASEVSEPRFLETSPVSVAAHLVLAGIWDRGQLLP